MGCLHFIRGTGLDCKLSNDVVIEGTCILLKFDKAALLTAKLNGQAMNLTIKDKNSTILCIRSRRATAGSVPQLSRLIVYEQQQTSKDNAMQLIITHKLSPCKYWFFHPTIRDIDCSHSLCHIYRLGRYTCARKMK